MKKDEKLKKKIPITRIGCMTSSSVYAMIKGMIVLIVTMLLNAYVLGNAESLLIIDGVLAIVLFIEGAILIKKAGSSEFVSINKQLKFFKFYGTQNNIIVTQDKKKCKKIISRAQNAEAEDGCILKCMEDDFDTIKEYGKNKPQCIFRAYTQAQITCLIVHHSGHYYKREFKRHKTWLGQKIFFETLNEEKRLIKGCCGNCSKFETADCKYKMSKNSNTYKKKGTQMYGVAFDFKEDI